MICSSIVAWVAGGLAVAGVAAAGTVVILTSGPAADSLPLAAATETATQAAVVTAAPAIAAATTTPSATPPATPTATTPPPSPAAAPVVLGPDGWPIVTCPSGFEVYKAPTRKLSLCAPSGWRGGIAQEFSAGKLEPEGYVAFRVQWIHPTDAHTRMSIQLVSNVSRGSREDWRNLCPSPETTTLLGRPAELCRGTAQEFNGQGINAPETWRLHVFAETDEFWLLVNAAGSDRGGPVAEGADRALTFAASAQAPQIERLLTQAPVLVGPDGWPLRTCPTDFEVYKATTRKLSLCAPAGWSGGIAQEFSGGKDEPKGYIQFLIEWRNPYDAFHFVGLRIVSRQSRGTRDTWRFGCASPVAEQLLGVPAERCFGDRAAPNGMPLNGGETWRLEIFAETPDYWVILDAAGTQQTSEAIAAAREDARLVGARALANGLARLQ